MASTIGHPPRDLTGTQRLVSRHLHPQLDIAASGRQPVQQETDKIA